MTTDFNIRSSVLPLLGLIVRSWFTSELTSLRLSLLGFFNSKIYTIDNIKADTKISENEIDYLLLKSKQRALKRINSRISKLNRYYNSNTELFARSVELYVKDKESFKMKAPFLYNKLTEALEKNQVPELTQLVKLAQI